VAILPRLAIICVVLVGSASLRSTALLASQALSFQVIGDWEPVDGSRAYLRFSPEEEFQDVFGKGIYSASKNVVRIRGLKDADGMPRRQRGIDDDWMTLEETTLQVVRKDDTLVVKDCQQEWMFDDGHHKFRHDLSVCKVYKRKSPPPADAANAPPIEAVP
jgi:hypothetical protein